MNRATNFIVSTLGILAGIAGLDHGIFEALHGNMPTGGLFIQSIGPANRMWPYGTEDAFTLVPNFLVTGILAILLSLAVMVWSVGFVGRRHGPAVLTALFVLLFLCGGGVAQVAFFVFICAASTRINAPLNGWRKLLPERLRRIVGDAWPYGLALGALLFFIALEIAIFGQVPGMNNPDQKQIVCWSSLGAGFVVLLLTFVAGFAHDIQASPGG